ncbi:MAG: hypothetical protein FJY29_04235 [Betaproteobacteria bacterium]|nr:hypothetical protein [Betaproteobacteria bacterium]
MRAVCVLVLLSLAAALPSCLRKKAPAASEDENQKPTSDVQFASDTSDTLNLEDSILEASVSFKSLESAFKSKPSGSSGVSINILVREDWDRTLPLKMKTGDVKKLSDGVPIADVVSLGEIPVKGLRNKPHSLKMLKKILKDIDSSEAAFDLITTEVNVKDANELSDILSKLNRTPGVLFAEPNAQIRAIALPNDPRMPELWGMSAIKAPDVWQSRTGGKQVTVAVIDTGIDLQHVDLKENLWKNTGEIPGNNIDDDGNGFVDDIHGWNFASLDNSPQDVNGHGSHCAGTIGAKGNNAKGVAGVNWNAQIMAVKILDDFGGGSFEAAYQGLLYAISNNAKILSNSWGTEFSSALFAKAISLARSKGVLVVAAAGNESAPKAIFPAYLTNVYPNVLSVASSEQSGDLSSFSNYADGVDIAAPGGGILSTVPGNQYQIFSGTSMAAPHVAGAAALLWNSFPNKSLEDIKTALLQGADYISRYEGKVSGARHLNLLGSVNKMLGIATPRPDAPPSLVEGLRFQYYEGKWNKLPNFSSTAITSAGTTSSLSLAVAPRNNNFALVFEGVIKIEAPGDYKFFLTSDDGSLLYVNDIRVIQNDGIHSAREKTGTLTLKNGYTKIRLEYFQASSGKRLKLDWKGPSFKRVNINKSKKLFHFM